ncbi:MAG: enoyl-CoA hydratase [Sphingobacteriaceae bacterium]|jgi:enoyl-CoA hydratase|nr:enoyl-CoA hydratase [Sphingobacteriaceae bacterium]
MEYQNLLVENRDRILFITINRPEKLNALNKATLQELHNAFSSALSDGAVGGIILTGAGAKAFVAGADISEFSSFNNEEGEKLARTGQTTVFNIIEQGTKPVIAAINGFALGGGLELAMACHIRIAAETARMGLPETTLGIIPGYGGTQRLTQLVGKGRALEMILSADMINAEEAYRIGLVNHVVSGEELISSSEKLMRTILSRSPIAVSAAIRAVNASFDKESNGYETEISLFGSCFGTPDFNEGVSAFTEKRKPDFIK